MPVLSLVARGLRSGVRWPVPPHLLHPYRQGAAVALEWEFCTVGGAPWAPQPLPGVSRREASSRPLHPLAAQMLWGTCTSTEERSEHPALSWGGCRARGGSSGPRPSRRAGTRHCQMMRFCPPPPFPLAEAVVSDANLLQLIAAASAAAAALIQVRGMLDCFRAHREPRRLRLHQLLPSALPPWPPVRDAVGQAWAGGGQAPTRGHPPLAAAAATGW